MREHWFWGILMLAVMVWYSTITLYVSIRGTRDIKEMLNRLKQGQDQAGPDDQASS